MKQHDLSVKVRESKGKGAARRIRKTGNFPAVFYGGKTESFNLEVPAKEFGRILSSDTGQSTLLNLTFDDGKTKSRMATIKDLHMDPVSDQFIHADFQELLMDQEMTATIPVKLIGKAKGVELGGTLQPIRRELTVSCLPKDLPNLIEVDITELGIGQSFHIDDIKLPAGVEVPHDVNFTVVVVLGKRGVEEEEAEGEVEGAEESTEEATA